MADTLNPIGVFWDIENCAVPRNKSALGIVQKIRRQFFHGHKEAEFMCVCDIYKEKKDIIQELNSGQVNVVHVNAVGKNAADDKLRQSLRRFSDTHVPPATIILISADVNFAADLSDLRHRKSFCIILIHNKKAHDSLIACANENHIYEDFVSDLPPRSPIKIPSGKAELQVKGFTAEVCMSKLKNKLRQISSNCGGRVTFVSEDYACVRFASIEAATRARKRMDGENIFGSKITVDFAAHCRPWSTPNTNNVNNNILSEPCRKPRPFRATPGSHRFGENYYVSPHRFRSESGSPHRYRIDSEEIPNHYRHNNGNFQKSGAFRYSGGYSNSYGEQNENLCYRPLTPNGNSIAENGYCADTEVKELFSRDGTKYSPRRPNSAYQIFNSMTPKSRNHIAVAEEHEVNDFINKVTRESNRYNHKCHSHSYYDEFNTYSHPSEDMYSAFNQSMDSSHYYPHYECKSGYYSRSPRTSPAYRSYSQPRFSPTYNEAMFRPVSEALPTSRSPSPLPLFYWNEDYSGPIELLVSNLDFNISAKEWRKILFTTFHQHVKVLGVYIKTQPDNTNIGMVRVSSVDEARFAISQLHRKKIGYRRIHVALKQDDSQATAINVRAEAVALLTESQDHTLPLFKFIELFDKRYHRSISVSELFKMRDTIEIRDQGGSGRMVYLVSDLQGSPSPINEITAMEIQDVLEQPLCKQHCPEGSQPYMEARNCSMLPSVQLQLKTFATQVHSLMQLHDGNMPLMSFTECYAAEFSPLFPIENGVPLEHLISCVPGIQIQVSKAGLKKVQWQENKPSSSSDPIVPDNNPLLAQQLGQLSREIVDLLRSNPQCRMPFSKFIPSYHHHFGRQCRVADYGYTKLMELFEAIPRILQVMGTGDRRVLTLTHKAQLKRFTVDLLKVLKLSCRQILVSELAEAFGKVLGKPLDITDYGVCCVEDMLSEIPSSTVTVTDAGTSSMAISVPRRDQSPEETELTKQFALEVVDLLKHNPRCRMPFNKFIPAYHHHFGHQCRVADYGFSKLIELFEALPHVVEMEEEGEERWLHLTEPELRKVLAEQVVTLLMMQRDGRLALDLFLQVFANHFSFNICLHDFGVNTVHELIAKIKHVVKLEVVSRRQYIVLLHHRPCPVLAYQILQLLMDQSGGSLPLVELCSRYKTTFKKECDISMIREELLDYVQISGDEDSSVISLAPLQAFAQDVRILLHTHPRLPLSLFEKTYQDHFGIEVKPALFGFQNLYTLLQSIPHIVVICGKPMKKFLSLSRKLEEISQMPPLSPKSLSPTFQRASFVRLDSNTPSSDSGVTDTHGDEVALLEHKAPSPIDILAASVPSSVPSPSLKPMEKPLSDLIRFDTPSASVDKFWNLSEDEKKGQRTPLCRTPTSNLLALAAQCLITDPPVITTQSQTTMPRGRSPANSLQPQTSSSNPPGRTPSPLESTDILEQLKGGWWKASPAQLEQITQLQMKSASSSQRSTPTEEIRKLEKQSSNTSLQTDKQKDTAIITKKKSPSVHNRSSTSPYKQYKSEEVQTEQFTELELPVSIPSHNVILPDCTIPASGTTIKLDSSLNTETNESKSTISLSTRSRGPRPGSFYAGNITYDNIFRENMPLETSSVKSEPSSFADISTSSPRKSPRRPRIAAIFTVPLDI